MPQRIQMSRQHPWRAEHPDAVIVDRRTRWGNPFRVVKAGSAWAVLHGNCAHHRNREDAAADAVRRFRNAIDLGWGDVPSSDQIRADLAGRDLACWCPLDQPCHADVLLALANPTPAPAGVSAAPTSRDSHAEDPAGAAIPTTSEEQCEHCGRILDCCRRCPVHEGDVG